MTNAAKRFILLSVLWQSLKSTSRHIFEKVLICIERGIFCTDIKEMNTFENFIFWKRCSFFTSQLSCSDPLASLEEKGNTFCNNHICILYIKKLVYIESLVFACCINITFPMNKVVFQILWALFAFFNWGVPQIFLARWKLMRNTFFEEQLVGCSSSLWQNLNLHYDQREDNRTYL